MATSKSGTEMAKAVFAELVALGATDAQARRAMLRAFARLALVLPGGLTESVEARALSIASGAES